MRGRRSAIGILIIVAMLALTSVGVAATAFPGKYTGKTTQGQPMSLVVGPSGRTVTIDMKYAYTCSPAGISLLSGDKWRAYLATTHKFRESWNTDQPVQFPDIPALGAGDLKATFTGTTSGLLGRTKAIGAYHEHMTVLDAAGTPVQQCDTGNVKFSLKPAKK